MMKQNIFEKTQMTSWLLSLGIVGALSAPFALALDIQWDVNQPPPGYQCSYALDLEGHKHLKKWSRFEKALLKNPKHIKIALNSLTFDYEIIKDIKGVSAYEERGLGVDISELARNSEQHMILPTSRSEDQIDDLRAIIEMYIGFVTDDISGVMDRIKILPIADNSSLPMSQKILQSSSVKKQLNQLIDEMSRSLGISREAVIFDPYISTPIEGALATEFNLAIKGNPSKNSSFESKTEYHRLTNGLGLEKADNIINLKNIDELVDGVFELVLRGHKKIMAKLNNGVSGLGNASLEIDDLTYRTLLEEGDASSARADSPGRRRLHYLLLKYLKPTNSALTPSAFVRELARVGGVVEQFIPKIKIDDGGNPVSPSGQMDIYPNRVEIVACHDQKFFPGGKGKFLGAKNPTMDPQICSQIVEMLKVVGEKLRSLGYIGRAAIDTVVTSDDLVKLVEINTRKGGTYTVDLVRNITDSTVSAKSESPWPYQLISNQGAGEAVFSEGTDNFEHEGLKEFRSDRELIGFLRTEFSGDLFSQETGQGIVPNLIAGRDDGKMGFVAVGLGSHEQAQFRFKEFEQKFIEKLNKKVSGVK